jgi:hypothetical protein
MHTNDSNNISKPLTEEYPPPFSLRLGLNSCSNEDYHADRTALSSSVWKKVLENIEDYYSEYILGIPSTKKMNQSALTVGSLTHTHILEPHLLNKEYYFIQAWDRRTTEYKNLVAAMSPTDTRKIVTMTEKNTVDRMMAVYKKHPVAPKFFQGGEAEVTIVAAYNLKTGAITFDEKDEGPDTVRIKVRFDYVNVDEGFIADAKTTAYPSDFDTFKATADSLDYPLSASLYLMIAEAYYKRSFKFYFVVLSKKDLTCDVHGFSLNKRILGNQKLARAFEKYKIARETNVWKENSVVAQTLVSANYEIQEI